MITISLIGQHEINSSSFSNLEEELVDINLKVLLVVDSNESIANNTEMIDEIKTNIEVYNNADIINRISANEEMKINISNYNASIITTKSYYPDGKLQYDLFTGDVDYKIEYIYDEVTGAIVEELHFENEVQIGNKIYNYIEGVLDNVISNNAEKMQLIFNDTQLQLLNDRITQLENQNLNDRITQLENLLNEEKTLSELIGKIQEFDTRITTNETLLSNGGISPIIDVEVLNGKIDNLIGRVVNGKIIDEFDFSFKNSKYILSREITLDDNVIVYIDGVELKEGVGEDYIIINNEITIFVDAIYGSHIIVELY